MKSFLIAASVVAIFFVVVALGYAISDGACKIKTCTLSTKPMGVTQ